MEVDKEACREDTDKDTFKCFIDLLLVSISANGNFSHLFLVSSS